MAVEKKKYCGIVVPMISPFTPTGQIDEPAVGRIVDYLVQNQGAVFCLGTTGESASISFAAKHQLLAATAAAVGGRAMIYAGISGNCFEESIELAGKAKRLGFDAVVAHSPNFYPLSDGEIESYFLRLADGVELPLVLYNIPATTHHSISLDSVDRLRRHPNIVALKDSANDPPRIAELLSRTGGRGGFPVLLGNSRQFTNGLKLGGVGLVPSGGHLAGDLYFQMFQAAMNDQWQTVESLQKQTDEICAQYLAGNSLGQGLAVLKALLEKRGLCSRTMLPPLIDYSGAV